VSEWRINMKVETARSLPRLRTGSGDSPRERQASSPSHRSSRSFSGSSGPQSPPPFPPSPATSNSSTSTFIRHPTPTQSASSSASSAFDSRSTMGDLEPLMMYRDRVRSKLPPNYSGRRHLLLLLAVNFLGSAIPVATLLVSGLEILRAAFVLMLTLVYANVVEYAIHRFAGHEGKSSRLVGVKMFRMYHAVVHHNFFGGGNAFHAEKSDDIFFILFPTWVYAGWLLCGLVPLLVLLALGLQAEVLFVIVAGLSFSLLQYEVLHTFHHRALPDSAQALLERIPALRAMQHRHRIHHSGGRNGCNYNITWPLSDALFRTLANESGGGSGDGGDGGVSGCSDGSGGSDRNSIKAKVSS